jgi:hypothetical protein
VYAAIGKSRALVSMSRPSRGGNDKHWRLVGVSDRGTHPAVRRVRCGIELVCGRLPAVRQEFIDAACRLRR